MLYVCVRVRVRVMRSCVSERLLDETAPQREFTHTV